MSEYTTSSTAIEVVPTNQELLASLLAEQLGASSTWVCSRAIRECRETLANSNGVPELRDVLGSVAMTMPTIAASSLALAESSLANGQVLSAQLLRKLDTGLALAHQQVLQVERIGTTTLAVRALEHSGFTVRCAENGSTSAIEARRGHSVLLIGVSAGGSMEMDWAGHSGDDCAIEMDRVREAFREEGLQIAVKRRDRHDSEGGGSLITRAARVGGGDLVSGLLSADSSGAMTAGVIGGSRRATLSQEA